MSKPRHLKDPDRIALFNSFISASISDYLAARTLFLSDLPEQAAVLSSTAIEKACKAVLAFTGNASHGHLQKAHWNAVRAFNPRLFGSFDTDFLLLCKKAYLLRYTCDLPPNFSLVIASREFLAHLDEMLVSFHRSFFYSDVGAQKTRMQVLIDSKDKLLFAENHMLTGEMKDEFIFRSPQTIYEVRQRSSKRLLEVIYVSSNRPRSNSLLREGCRVIDESKDIYEFSHFEPPSE